MSAESVRLPRSSVVAIIAMSFAVFAIANDVTAMSVALTAIEADLGTDVATVQWVVSAYALTFGVLIVPGGRLADLFGRRRLLFIGAGVFALFSAVGAAAPDVLVLILARAAMGVGGALMWPAVLGLIYTILPPSRAALAGGIVIGVAGLGNAAGPLVGGGLTQLGSWRWILVLNIPIALLTCLVTWRTVQRDAATSRDHRIDYGGIGLLSCSLVALLIALGQAPSLGWGDPLVVCLLVVSVVTFALFMWREKAAGPGALVPRSVITNRPFLAACAAMLLMSSTFFAALLYLPQYFQKVFDLDVMVAGLALLPMMVMFAAASFTEGWLVRRIGLKAVVSAGAVLFAAGPILLVAFAQPGGSYVALLPGLVILGLGIGLFYSAATAAGLEALDPSQSSLAGGILYMFQVAGGAVGLGVTTSVFLAGANRSFDADVSAADIQLTGDQADVAQGVLAGTDASTELFGSLPTDTADQLLQIIQDSFVSGFRWALALDAALALAGVAVCLFAVGGPLRRRVAVLVDADESTV